MLIFALQKQSCNGNTKPPSLAGCNAAKGMLDTNYPGTLESDSAVFVAQFPLDWAGTGHPRGVQGGSPQFE